MVGPRSLAAAGAVVLSLALPSAAAAGPVAWELSAELVRAGDAVGPMADWLTPEFIGGGTTIHETTFSRLSTTGPHAGSGWQTVRVGSVTPDGPRYDPLHWAEQTFDVRLTLTDTASGQSGVLTFGAAGWEVLEQDYDNPGVLVGRSAFVNLTGDAEQPLTLGGVDYRIGLSVEARDGATDLVASVRTGDVVSNPEPGTLALAGVGLGVAGLVRRRSGLRRAAAQGSVRPPRPPRGAGGSHTMVRSRPAPWLGALAALLAAPQLAPAGPLTWGFRAETPEGVVLRDITGITDSYYGDHFLADPQFYGTYQGSVIGVGFRSESWETAAWLTFTDETSGATGESRVWWRWVKEYDRRPDGSEDQIYEGYNSGPWYEPARLTLGAHVYEVRGPGGDLQVTVTPFVPVAAPEPTTLALAGVGLVPLLGRIARRRMTRCA